MTGFTGCVRAFAAAVLGACALAATAKADVYGRPVGVVGAPCCQLSWSGVYVGLNGGHGFGDDEGVLVTETAAGVPIFAGSFGSHDLGGGFGGAQIGANWQAGALVLGIEADVQGGHIGGDSFATVTPYLGPGTSITVGTSNSVRVFGTLRPRIGVAMGNWLLYGTGGLAWGRVRHTMAMSDSLGFVAADRATRTQAGYAAGAGLEYALSPNLSLKLEYQYIDLGSEGHQAVETLGGAATAFAIATDTETNFHTVRLGLNFRFPSHAEVVPLK